MDINSLKINVIIDDTEDKNYIIEYKDNVLTLIFPDAQSLRNFLGNKELIKLRDDTLNQDKLNKIINQIKEKAQKAIITIYNYLDPSKTTILDKDTKIIYDLTNLSILDELHFLKSFPLSNQFLFIDKYNELEEKSYPELIKAYDIILKAEAIFRKFNLSNAEYIFLVYDLVRFRKPLKGKKAISRDLVNVLNSEEIVCLGYINIFNALLELLGIYSEKLEWNPKDVNDLKGHVDSVVYLNDTKYNIHCLNAFDPSWDISIYQNDICQFSFIPLALDKFHKDNSNLNLINGSKYNLLKYKLERMKAIDDLREKELKYLIGVLRVVYNHLGRELPSQELLNDLNFLEKTINDLDYEIISVKKIKEIITKAREVGNILIGIPSDTRTIESLVASTFSSQYDIYNRQTLARTKDN